ncbi:nucleotide exchange factor GrpE [Couchioplanes azureus]|uniref:nucleotide exchange factor GrpE n=1 Tax=Couchioplanes caeruleus TaxID=56438 RepID=UPI00166F6DA3|nr:nucleotide exchange factor GrpE [Couchioplanes caeruleus]GGQ38134.1 hypothetical protein GCM10010166_00640 [Couchioplanes caeruleus subsp. azureus]
MTSAQHKAPADPARDGAQTGADEPAVPAGADAAASGAGPGASRPAAVEMEDRWRRAVAELDNTRKRHERQLAEQARAERARTAAAFLPMLDNLELALRHADADPAAIVSGVMAVRAQTVDVLSRLGLHRIDPGGQPFDPARHEAARVVAAGEDTPPGTVVEVLRPGFVDADGTLVRPAVVTVAQQQLEEQSSEGCSGGDGR